MNTYLGDQTTADQDLRILVGREVVNVRYGSEKVTLELDDGIELEIDASLDCCAYGEVSSENVVGGKIMSISADGTRGNAERESEYSDGPDSVYRLFLLKDGLPGTITVNSYESNGYYGTGYTLYVNKPEENQ